MRDKYQQKPFTKFQTPNRIIYGVVVNNAGEQVKYIKKFDRWRDGVVPHQEYILAAKSVPFWSGTIYLPSHNREWKWIKGIRDMYEEKLVTKFQTENSTTCWVVANLADEHERKYQNMWHVLWQCGTPPKKIACQNWWFHWQPGTMCL